MTNLCQKCMDDKVDDYLGVLPVLHYFMDLSPPRRDGARQSEDSWAALEGVSYSQFREKASDG